MCRCAWWTPSVRCSSISTAAANATSLLLKVPSRLFSSIISTAIIVFILYCDVIAGSRIEGIGRPRVEESFIPQLVDRMLKVTVCPVDLFVMCVVFVRSSRCSLCDAGSRCGCHRVLSLSQGEIRTECRRQHRCLIPHSSQSSCRFHFTMVVSFDAGCNTYGLLQLLSEMHRKGERGSIVSLIADGGERYQDTYYNAKVCPFVCCLCFVVYLSVCVCVCSGLRTRN